MRRPMNRIAVLAALLIAVCAYGGNNDYTGNGDVTIRSYDRTVVIGLDTNADGSPDRAFVVGINKALEKPLDLRWAHVNVELRDDSLLIVDSAKHNAFAAAAKAPAEFAITRVEHVIGVAQYWGLKPDFKLESLAKNW
jgi:hypothetical protein